MTPKLDPNAPPPPQKLRPTGDAERDKLVKARLNLRRDEGGRE